MQQQAFSIKRKWETHFYFIKIFILIYHPLINRVSYNTSRKTKEGVKRMKPKQTKEEKYIIERKYVGEKSLIKIITKMILQEIKVKND